MRDAGGGEQGFAFGEGDIDNGLVCAMGVEGGALGRVPEPPPDAGA